MVRHASTGHYNSAGPRWRFSRQLRSLGCIQEQFDRHIIPEVELWISVANFWFKVVCIEWSRGCKSLSEYSSFCRVTCHVSAQTMSFRRQFCSFQARASALCFLQQPKQWPTQFWPKMPWLQRQLPGSWPQQLSCLFTMKGVPFWIFSHRDSRAAVASVGSCPCNVFLRVGAADVGPGSWSCHPTPSGSTNGEPMAWGYEGYEALAWWARFHCLSVPYYQEHVSRMLSHWGRHDSRSSWNCPALGRSWRQNPIRCVSNMRVRKPVGCKSGITSKADGSLVLILSKLIDTWWRNRQRADPPASTSNGQESMDSTEKVQETDGNRGY